MKIHTAIFASLLALPAAFADDVTWINSTEPSSWFTPENWSNTAVPTTDDAVTIFDGTAQVASPGAATGSLFVAGDGGGGALEISGTGSLTSDTLFAGVDGIGSVTVSGGATMTTGSDQISAAIGGFLFAPPMDPGTGTVTVTGAGSQWTAGTEVQLGVDNGGGAGNGTLDVLAGGKVVIGDFDVNPEDSSRLFVGVGTNSTTTGQVTVSGTGSELTAYLLGLGAYFGPSGLLQGSGSLSVADGGLVKSSLVGMGSFPGSGGSATGHISIAGTAGSRGVLQAASVQLGTGTIDFDGGILRAEPIPDGYTGKFLEGEDGTFATLEAGGAFIDTNGLDAEVALPLTGAGGLTKLGEGKLTLTGANDFTGGITVEAGELAPGNDAAYGTGNALTVNGGSIGFNGHSYTTSTLNGTGGTVNLDDVTLTLASATNSEFKGIIAGEFGVVVKSGDGEAILSGANTYTGGTRITGGALIAGHDTALGTGTVTLDGGSLRIMNGITVANPVSVGTNGGWINNYGGFAQAAFTGAITLAGDVTLGAFSDAPASMTVSGGITGTGNVALTTPESAILTISGAAVNPTGTLSHNGDGTGSTTISAEIGANVTSITQDGGTPLVLSGTSAAYTGTLTVRRGMLKITGAITSSRNDPFASVTEINNGTLSVDGGSLTQELGGLYVGNVGPDNGTLEIKNGGTVSNAYAYVGAFSGSTGTATVTGTDSTWTSANSLSVGYMESVGTLTVSAGGRVISNGSYLGYGSSSSGTATVTGTGSLWQNADVFYVGNGGSGTLTISNGGAVTTGVGGTGTVNVASVGGVTGTIDIGAHDLLSPTTAGTLNAAAVAFGSGTGTINFNQTDATTFAANISGAGRVVQRGGGTTTLTGTSTYGGPTQVMAGKLLVNGSITSDVSVAGGATLGGSGRVSGITLDSGAALTPGGDNAIGTFNATSLTWNAGAVISIDLGATTSDLLKLSGALTKGGTGEFQFQFRDAGWREGQTYTLIDFGSTDFDHAASDFSFGNVGGFDGTFAINGTSLQFTLVAIPEPSTFGLALIGLLIGLSILRMRRKGTGIFAAPVPKTGE